MQYLETLPWAFTAVVITASLIISGLAISYWWRNERDEYYINLSRCLPLRNRERSPMLMTVLWTGLFIGVPIIALAGIMLALVIVAILAPFALLALVLWALIYPLNKWGKARAAKQEQARLAAERANKLHAGKNASWRNQSRYVWSYTGADASGKNWSFGWLQAKTLGHGLYRLYYRYEQSGYHDMDDMIVVDADGQMAGDWQWVLNTVSQITEAGQLLLPENFRRLQRLGTTMPWQTSSKWNGQVFEPTPVGYTPLGCFSLMNGALIGIAVKNDSYDHDTDRFCVSVCWQHNQTDHVLVPLDFVGLAAGEAFESGLRHGRSGMQPLGGMWAQTAQERASH